MARISYSVIRQFYVIVSIRSFDACSFACGSDIIRNSSAASFRDSRSCCSFFVSFGWLVGWLVVWLFVCFYWPLRCVERMNSSSCKYLDTCNGLSRLKVADGQSGRAGITFRSIALFHKSVSETPEMLIFSFYACYVFFYDSVSSGLACPGLLVYHCKKT